MHGAFAEVFMRIAHRAYQPNRHSCTVQCTYYFSGLRQPIDSFFLFRNGKSLGANLNFLHYKSFLTNIGTNGLGCYLCFFFYYLLGLRFNVSCPVFVLGCNM